jgi:SulP family sulfate permease
VSGQVFFASSEAFVDAFDAREDDLREVRLDLTQAHFWDLTGVSALDKVVFRFREAGVPIHVEGLNKASATLVARLGQHDKQASAEPAGH